MIRPWRNHCSQIIWLNGKPLSQEMSSALLAVRYVLSYYNVTISPPKVGWISETYIGWFQIVVFEEIWHMPGIVLGLNLQRRRRFCVFPVALRNNLFNPLFMEVAFSVFPKSGSPPNNRMTPSGHAKNTDDAWLAGLHVHPLHEAFPSRRGLLLVPVDDEPYLAIFLPVELFIERVKCQTIATCTRNAFIPLFGKRVGH